MRGSRIKAGVKLVQNEKVTRRTELLLFISDVYVPNLSWKILVDHGYLLPVVQWSRRRLRSSNPEVAVRNPAGTSVILLFGIVTT